MKPVDRGGRTASLRHTLRMIRRGNNPRWQGHVTRLLIGSLAAHRILSFDTLLRMEWAVRRLLGQPLSRRDWGRMMFTDKVNYRRLRDHDAVFQTFCDKMEMRRFVTERLGAHSVPDLLQVGPRAAEFGERPGPYVLKANHGSGMVTYVGEGRTLSMDDMQEAERWLATDYAWRGLEWAYRGARPLLLAEEELYGADGSSPPPEYKLFTFQGKVEMIQVDMDRFGDHRRLLRRPDWTPLDGMLLYPRPDDTDQRRPDTLDLMVAWASTLGQDLDFIRVDLYDVGERIYVGELTPYPGNGRVRFEPESLDTWLGRKWRSIPEVS
jgi:hypothetical protein